MTASHLTPYIFIIIEGLWKESDDDPFTNLHQGYTTMIGAKQTHEEAMPRLIDPRELDKAVRTKNILHKVATTNRGPNPPVTSPAD